LNTSLSFRSILSVFNSNGSYSGLVAEAIFGQQNPYMLVDINNWDRRQNVNIFGIVYLAANILENLLFDSNLAIERGVEELMIEPTKN